MVQHLSAKNEVHGAIGKRQPVGIHARGVDLLALASQLGKLASLLQAFHSHISRQYNRPATRHFNCVAAAAAADIKRLARLAIAQQIESIHLTGAQWFRQQRRQVKLFAIDTLVEFLLLVYGVKLRCPRQGRCIHLFLGHHPANCFKPAPACKQKERESAILSRP